MADAPAELSTLLSGLLFETITLIEPNELTDEERALIPDWWNEAVRLPGRDGLERALAAWQSTIPDALPSFHAVLRKHGLGVFLGRSDSTNKPLLAYAANPGRRNALLVRLSADTRTIASNVGPRRATDGSAYSIHAARLRSVSGLCRARRRQRGMGQVRQPVTAGPTMSGAPSIVG